MKLPNKILKVFNIEIHKTASLQNEQAYYENTLNLIAEFYIDFYSTGSIQLNNKIAGVVFSKDRAMQLAALLGSYFYYTKNPAPLFILFTYSSPQHAAAYELLQKEFQSFSVSFIAESNFHFQLNEIVTGIEADRIFFMTDDAIFLDHYDLNDCLNFDPVKHIFSLRHGTDLSYCFPYKKNQLIPDFVTETIDGEKFYTWTWAHMKDSPDWIYPLSIDAAIFLKKEMGFMLSRIEFQSPNSLESAMQLYNPLFLKRKGVCYSKVKYVNVTCNMVQKEFNNNSIGSFTAEELLERFNNGERINWKQLGGLRAPEAQKVKFTFIKTGQIV